LRHLTHLNFYLGFSKQPMSDDNHECDSRTVTSRRFEQRWMVSTAPATAWAPVPITINSPLEDVQELQLRVKAWSQSNVMPSVDSIWLILTANISQNALREEFGIASIAKGEGWKPMHGTRKSDAIPDVGVAVQFPSGAENFECNCYFYSSLPLPAPTGLPIHCHGPFATSADRRTLRTDNESGDWNRFILRDCLTELYFALLERLCMQSTVAYYSLWPSLCSKDESTISGSLHSEFWEKVRKSSRKLILGPINTPLCIGEVILDPRPRPLPFTGNDEILEAVNVLRPSSTVIYQPTLNAALLSKCDEDVYPMCDDIEVINQTFLCQLLREHSAESVVSHFHDSQIQEVLNFVMEKSSNDRLLGCYIWRVKSGRVFKLEHVDSKESNILYLIDEEGFRLFEEVAGDVLVCPQTMKPEVRENWNLGHEYNIRLVDSSAIDKFMAKALPSETLRSVEESKAKWILEVWKYVESRNFTVGFHHSCPCIPLKSRNNFVSTEAFKILPIMGTGVPLALQVICEKLNIHLLDAKYKKQFMEVYPDWTPEIGFLECLSRLNAQRGGDIVDNFRDALKPLTADEFQVHPSVSRSNCSICAIFVSEFIRQKIPKELFKSEMQCHTFQFGHSLLLMVVPQAW
jgi:hypothetical protein